jgi:WD40 repeat protein
LLWTSAAQSSPVAKVSVAPDGKHLAAAYRDSSVRYWDTGANSFLQAPPSTQAAAGEYVRMLSFLMGGRKILVGLKSGTWLWDLSAAPSAVRRLPRGADAVSPDERIAVTLGQYVGLGAQGYTPLTLWDLNTGGEITTVNTARGMLAVSAAFTRDGTALLASTNAGEILVWRP